MTIKSSYDDDPNFFEDLWSTLRRVFRANLKADTTQEWEKKIGHIPRHAIFSAIHEICRSEDKLPSLAMIRRYSRNYLPTGLKPTVRHSEGVDDEGTPCWYWEDEGGAPAYLAQDCPEGRAFLAALKQLSVKKDLSKALEEAQQKKAPFEITQAVVDRVIGRRKK